MKYFATSIAAILACCAVAGCNLAPDDVEITFTAAEPAGFDAGYAGTCTLRGNVYNYSKNHVESITYKVGTFDGEEGEIFANAHADDVTLLTVTLSQQETCADQVRYLNANIGAAQVLGCKMTGVSEGDCQEKVHIKSKITDADIQAIADREQKERDAAFVPLHQALGAVANARDDNQILDALVQLDSLSWSMNHYDSGSMHDAQVVGDDGSQRTIRASYTFNNGRSGWVKATLYRDPSLLPCLEFWDFAGSCRTIHLPDPQSYTPPTSSPYAAQAPQPSAPSADSGNPADAPPAPDQSAAPPAPDAPAANDQTPADNNQAPEQNQSDGVAAPH